jgi:hypothetical protein
LSYWIRRTINSATFASFVFHSSYKEISRGEKLCLYQKFVSPMKIIILQEISSINTQLEPQRRWEGKKVREQARVWTLQFFGNKFHTLLSFRNGNERKIRVWRRKYSLVGWRNWFDIALRLSSSSGAICIV